jgi:hypothetical protein
MNSDRTPLYRFVRKNSAGHLCVFWAFDWGSHVKTGNRPMDCQERILWRLFAKVPSV